MITYGPGPPVASRPWAKPIASNTSALFFGFLRWCVSTESPRGCCFAILLFYCNELDLWSRTDDFYFLTGCVIGRTTWASPLGGISRLLSKWVGVPFFIIFIGSGSLVWSAKRMFSKFFRRATIRKSKLTLEVPPPSSRTSNDVGVFWLT